MKLKKLLKDIPLIIVKGSKELDITGICINSKLVSPGNLFIARKGRSDDGTKYIPEAISAGAVAILTDMYDPSLKDITQLIYPDIAQIEGILAAHFYQFASHELYMVGITGTNGKTTTSLIIKHLLDDLSCPCGLIGTIENIIGNQHYQAKLTTPDVTTNHKLLREMVLHGCQSAVMEVTSHALDQGRVQYIDYDVAVFTNLTLDHLDYHQTMENYFLAKKKLFSSLGKGKKDHKKAAVINADSAWSSQIIEGCPAHPLTYGIDNSADLHAKNLHFTPSGTSFDILYQGKSFLCKTPLVGRFNVYNILAAIGVALSKNFEMQEIIKSIASFKYVSGRLEPVMNQLDLKIYVDFAHSDDALKNVLESLSEFKQKRIITVFGCGGDRDQSKRAKMAHVSETFSDITIITSDNPRSEDPVAIAKQIIQGFQRQDSYLVELDRFAAINKAIEIGEPDDIILIAGKGHESYQLFANKILEFDDRKIASQICQEKWCERNRKV